MCGLQGLYGLVVYGIIRWTMCLECCAEEKPKKFPSRHQSMVTPIPVYSLPNRVSDESALTKTQDLSPSQVPILVFFFCFLIVWSRFVYFSFSTNECALFFAPVLLEIVSKLIPLSQSLIPNQLQRQIRTVQ